MSLFPDIFSQPSAPSGGLFGGVTTPDGNMDWSHLLGILGATLKDVSTHGQSNNLAMYQKQFQAMADQAQRDAIAKRLGDAFTQPNQVAVTPAVNDMSAQAPQLRTQADAINAQPFATPSPQDLAPILAQGIGAGVDPSPYISLQKLESQKQARILTPDEMASFGFRPGTVGIIDENGVPKVLQASDVKSQDALNQDIWLKKNDPHLSIDQQNANTNAARVKLEQDQAGSIDPATVHYWAQSVAGGGPMPTLGMGKQAAAYRQAILQEAARINSGKGLGGTDQNAITGTTKANTAALSKQTQLRSATESFENTMLQNMNVARDLLKKGAGTTGVPIFNRWQRYVRGEYAGDPDVVALDNAIDTVADENAKIRSGTLGNTPATDSMRANIKAGLNGAMTPDQIEKAFQVMEKDAGNRSRALRAQEDALRSALKGKSDMPNIPGIHEPQSHEPAAATGGKAARTGHYDPATGKIIWQ